MIQINEYFASYVEASNWMNTYLANYHPCGYGTSLNEPLRCEDGRWVVRGSRSSSCD